MALAILAAMPVIFSDVTAHTAIRIPFANLPLACDVATLFVIQRPPGVFLHSQTCVFSPTYF